MKMRASYAYVTVAEAATLLNPPVTGCRIRQYIADGRLPATPIGGGEKRCGQYLILRGDLWKLKIGNPGLAKGAKLKKRKKGAPNAKRRRVDAPDQAT